MGLGFGVGGFWFWVVLGLCLFVWVGDFVLVWDWAVGWVFYCRMLIF